MAYRYLCKDTPALIRQIACRLLNHGYCFYSVGWIPDHKDPLLVDAKLIVRYQTHLTKAQNFRRAAKGSSKVQYLRAGQLVVLLATKGEHAFFEREAWKDAKVHPLHIGGYSLAVSPQRQKARVRIHREAYNALAREFEAVACKRSLEWWESQFRNFPFDTGYAGVRSQVLTLMRAVNLLRKRVRLDPVEWDRCGIKKKLRSDGVFADEQPREVLELLGSL